MSCNFCGKSHREVAKLVASELGTAICDECLVVAFVKMTGSGIKMLPPLDELKEALKPKKVV